MQDTLGKLCVGSVATTNITPEASTAAWCKVQFSDRYTAKASTLMQPNFLSCPMLSILEKISGHSVSAGATWLQPSVTLFVTIYMYNYIYIRIYIYIFLHTYIHTDIKSAH